jgi:hypothetical protein
MTEKLGILGLCFRLVSRTLKLPAKFEIVQRLQSKDIPLIFF